MKVNKIIIVDIDGTIADNSHRSGILDSTLEDKWNIFYSKCNLDIPINSVISSVKTHIESRSTDYIVFLTGRPTKYRDKTLQWLKTNFKDDKLFEKVDGLIMRKNNDYRSSAEFKKACLDDLKVEVNYSSILAYEDELSNINMFRSEGVEVIAC